ncbi:PEP-CTERM sorting domain-containing protein [Agarivorans sp. 1_MG-2023]|uniref:PEP-CTERM sorting domain-containing protein n=1 Tax=Agarivorans sp. 1_MG-2023 TaxID=3062634 RepID=UPI0026E2E81F|nr:PEP-CTERM sorting domain-containing protein [Agarivorans sp. 1_MG-2023]MDO6762301.1 PEP-CTERM sorting domain-containing protein [Agarivorans sp. 1_MG-2023]
MKATKTLSAFVVIVSSFTANATFISGDYTLENGKEVALQGLEWMPLTYSQSYSRLYVEADGGWTDRFGNQWQANDWRYATRNETATLLNSLWGGVYLGFSNDNFIGASWFINYFGGLGMDTSFGLNRVDLKLNNSTWDNYDVSQFLFGKDWECSDELRLSCIGEAAAADGFYRSLATKNIHTGYKDYMQARTPLGYFDSRSGVDAGLNSDNRVRGKSNSSSMLGSLLVRQPTIVEVPEPSSLGLLMVSLFGLLVRRVMSTQKTV